MSRLSGKYIVGYRVLKITDLTDTYLPLRSVSVEDPDDRVDLVWRALDVLGLFDLVWDDFFKFELFENVPSLINAHWQHAAFNVMTRNGDC